MPTGIIMKGIGGFYYVKTGDKVYECKARGIFRKDEQTPLPGDRVNISVIDEAKQTGSMDKILPRDSHLVRPAVANVNQIITVIAVKAPAPDFALLDKLLITAELKRITPVICINKTDLDKGRECDRIIGAYESTGYRIIAVSSKFDIGYDQLKEVMHDRITVFAGQSGVGKSTILNRIMESKVMQTGEVSEKIERGKHTTRHAELVELETGGYVLDTPGFSSFELSEIKYDELANYFPEFYEHLGKCRFAGCSHISEPDCSIRDALDKGLIGKERYKMYTEFYNTLKQFNPYKDKEKKRNR